MLSRTLFLVACLAVLAPARARAAPPVDTVFFENRIRPVLASRCVSCHSGPNPAARLRLDRRLERGVAARLVRAIRHDGAIKMPPTGKLPADQIADLEAWGKAGALWPERLGRVGAAHWAYQTIRRRLAPPVEGAATDIDAFVRATLAKNGLTPAPAADRRTLLRRVTFDLTGLPPTPNEVAAFLGDTRPGAYERVVDRLLASPAYGERWARHWLDLVRYGESMGHEGDYDIPLAYQYRDYVVRALNADVPYDRFVREHLAGDLLPKPRRDPQTGRNESLLGTGFFWLGEGKHSPVDVRQEQADRIDNQIDVLGKAFLAQTVACARCHDHKFDPIPTADYYGLYGMLKSSRFQFATVDAPAVFERPAREIDAVQRSLDRPALAAAWATGLAALGDEALQAVGATPLPDFSGIALLENWAATGAAFSALGRPGDLTGTPSPGLLSGLTAHSALRSRRFEGALRSPTFTIDRDYLHLKLSGRGGRVHLIVESFQVIRDPIYGPLSFSLDNDRPAWRTVDLRLWKGRRAYIELSDSPLANLSQSFVAPLDKPFDGWLRLDGAALTDAPTPPERPNALAGKSPSEMRTALAAALAAWGAGQTAAGDALAVLDRLLAEGKLDAAPIAALQPKIAAIEATLPLPTRALAMCEGTGEDERIFVRGGHATLGAPAPRLALALCRWEKSPPTPTGSGRLELARRLTDGTHPLLARVIVNRVWKHHFGTGIVPTPDDFGQMGERPSHPELLDFLAASFVRDDRWSLKKLHRRIVLTQTYRQSSAASDRRAERTDPKNILLHRMPVRRLEAEAIRDAMLSVSGRLDPTRYGPGVPIHLTEFVEGRGRPESGPLDGNGRRSLYLAVRRNFLSPFALAFDFPIPFTCIGRRSVSNVPAQALALLNGAFVQQQAEVWAARLIREMPAAPDEARIVWLYETAFSRPPTVSEIAAARAFLSTPPDGTPPDARHSPERSFVPQSPRPLSPVGEGDLRGSVAALCHVLFNVKEFVFIR